MQPTIILPPRTEASLPSTSFERARKSQSAFDSVVRGISSMLRAALPILLLTRATGEHMPSRDSMSRVNEADRQPLAGFEQHPAVRAATQSQAHIAHFDAPVAGDGWMQLADNHFMTRGEYERQCPPALVEAAAAAERKAMAAAEQRRTLAEALMQRMNDDPLIRAHRGTNPTVAAVGSDLARTVDDLQQIGATKAQLESVVERTFQLAQACAAAARDHAHGKLSAEDAARRRLSLTREFTDSILRLKKAIVASAGGTFVPQVSDITTAKVRLFGVWVLEARNADSQDFARLGGTEAQFQSHHDRLGGLLQRFVAFAQTVDAGGATLAQLDAMLEEMTAQHALWRGELLQMAHAKAA